MTKSNFKLFESLNQPSQIFQNEEVFEPSFIPECLLHRETELETLVQHFKPILNKSPTVLGTHAIIQGSVGLGKTTIVKQFGSTLETYCRTHQHEGISQILFFHLNCRRQRSWSILFTTVLRQLVAAFPVRGFSAAELLTYIGSIMTERKQKLLLCLDEIDYLIAKAKGQDILYALIRNNEGNMLESNFPLSLVLITRSPHLYTYLDSALYSSLSKRMIVFHPYSTIQLYDILLARAKRGLNNSTYSNEILKEIAEIAHTSGDARYALELLWRAAKVSEGEHANEILFEHVRKAQVSSFPIKQSLITDLPLHQKYVLFSIASILKQQTDTMYALTADIKRKYEGLCHNKGLRPRKQTQFWVYLQELHKIGLIRLKVINRHKQGKSLGRTGRVSISDFPVNELFQLLQQVLQEK
ncbi:MAG: Cdc6/Cdc18 family protein [Candidatus Hodarchaeales archaeon]|jgi:cell division control protein 6